MSKPDQNNLHDEVKDFKKKMGKSFKKLDKRKQKVEKILSKMNKIAQGKNPNT